MPLFSATLFALWSDVTSDIDAFSIFISLALDHRVRNAHIFEYLLNRLVRGVCSKNSTVVSQCITDHTVLQSLLLFGSFGWHFHGALSEHTADLYDYRLHAFYVYCWIALMFAPSTKVMFRPKLFYLKSTVFDNSSIIKSEQCKTRWVKCQRMIQYFGSFLYPTQFRILAITYTSKNMPWTIRKKSLILEIPRRPKGKSIIWPNVPKNCKYQLASCWHSKLVNKF